MASHGMACQVVFKHFILSHFLEREPCNLVRNIFLEDLANHSPGMASTDNVQDTGSHEDPASSGDQEQSGVFMACLFQANRLGVAFYDSGTCEVWHAIGNEWYCSRPLHSAICMLTLACNPAYRQCMHAVMHG